MNLVPSISLKMGLDPLRLDWIPSDGVGSLQMGVGSLEMGLDHTLGAS